MAAPGAGIARARPWLGTIVTVRAGSDAGGPDIGGPDEAAAIAAVEAAFAAVARVHAAMSFQSPASNLAALARLGAGERVEVSPDTLACLADALALARASGGAFDPVVPGMDATWRDLVPDAAGVTVRRPLRVDLSGIAKGYAVDRAVAALRGGGVARGAVNAGGDLAVFGMVETIALRPAYAAPPVAIELADGALASSDVAGSRAEYGRACHRDGRTGAALSSGFVCVTAPRCVDADGLTKAVLALGDRATDLLAAYGASAYLHDPARGWRQLGERG